MFAGINGYLDALEVSSILPFEAALYEKMDTTYSALAEDIRKNPKFTDDQKAQMKKIIEETSAELV